MMVELTPVGQDAQDLQPGDFILAHRKGLASRIIRWGQRIFEHDPTGAYWSHAAFVENPTTLIEALTKGVVSTALSDYRNIRYGVVRTNLMTVDADQAVAFARSCVGQHYGWLVILGIMLRFLTPGRGLWFGMDGTEICSGLVAQALCRGWANFSVNPTSISPAELAEHFRA